MSAMAELPELADGGSAEAALDDASPVVTFVSAPGQVFHVERRENTVTPLARGPVRVCRNSRSGLTYLQCEDVFHPLGKETKAVASPESLRYTFSAGVGQVGVVLDDVPEDIARAFLDVLLAAPCEGPVGSSEIPAEGSDATDAVAS